MLHVRVRALLARPLALAAPLAAALLVASPVAAQVTAPEAHFGFAMGTDRRLATAEAIHEYFVLVGSQSDRVVTLDMGPTTDGRPTPVALVSAPSNIQNLERIGAVNARLADPRSIDPEEARALAADHKVVLAIGAGIHAAEIGPTQAAVELLYRLATAIDSASLAALDDIVILLMPTLNPDGHRLVIDWYRQGLDTVYEGGPMPWLYHKYAGHDVNRDAFMLNLIESRNLARLFYAQWHPQVFLTLHQMGENGPRFFVPPTTDPIDANYDPVLWRTAGLLGSAMALELQREGKSGVVSNAIYDYYWPGYEDSAPLGHNVVCLLAEVASVRIATPVTIEPDQLAGAQKGLPEYRPQVNFPDPWQGGTWTLGDIVDYDLTAVQGLLKAVSAYRGEIVQNFYDMGRRAVEAGQRGGPFAFLVPPDQHDPHAAARLQDLLIQGGIDVYRALEPFRADGDPYPPDTLVVPMAQPFRAYVKTLLERQQYPGGRRLPDGAFERPYDAAGWSLPDQMGVRVKAIDRYFQVPAATRLDRAFTPAARVGGERRPEFYLIDGRGNGGAIAANRLRAAGLEVSWTMDWYETGGYRYAPGSLVVTASRRVEALAATISSGLGLRVDGKRGRAPATRAIGRARVGLYRSFVANIDEGWTRWLLERYEFRFDAITDQDVRAGNLRARFDAIVVPSTPPDRLREGHSDQAVPAEYAGGLGDGGLAALREFVEAGGTLVALDQAALLAIELFDLPLRDVARDAGDRFFCPGSILRVNLDPTHPLSFGMPAATAGVFLDSSAYAGIPARGPSASPEAPPGQDLRTAARYGQHELLLSGWIEGGDIIAGQSAVIEARAGAGRVVLLGFRVQHRGQSHATFRLLFNALLTS